MKERDSQERSEKRTIVVHLLFSESPKPEVYRASLKDGEDPANYALNILGKDGAYGYRIGDLYSGTIILEGRARAYQTTEQMEPGITYIDAEKFSIKDSRRALKKLEEEFALETEGNIYSTRTIDKDPGYKLEYLTLKEALDLTEHLRKKSRDGLLEPELVRARDSSWHILGPNDKIIEVKKPEKKR